jgi:hypothetical protein
LDRGTIYISSGENTVTKASNGNHEPSLLEQILAEQCPSVATEKEAAESKQESQQRDIAERVFGNPRSSAAVLEDKMAGAADANNEQVNRGADELEPGDAESSVALAKHMNWSTWWAGAGSQATREVLVANLKQGVPSDVSSGGLGRLKGRLVGLRWLLQKNWEVASRRLSKWKDQVLMEAPTRTPYGRSELGVLFVMDNVRDCLRAVRVGEHKHHSPQSKGRKCSAFGIGLLMGLEDVLFWYQGSGHGESLPEPIGQLECRGHSAEVSERIGSWGEPWRSVPGRLAWQGPREAWFAGTELLPGGTVEETETYGLEGGQGVTWGGSQVEEGKRIQAPAAEDDGAGDDDDPEDAGVRQEAEETEVQRLLRSELEAAIERLSETGGTAEREKHWGRVTTLRWLRGMPWACACDATIPVSRAQTPEEARVMRCGRRAMHVRAALGGVKAKLCKECVDGDGGEGERRFLEGKEEVLEWFLEKSASLEDAPSDTAR